MTASSFSEFQTLEEDVFGEMLNVMTDGHYNIQKGKMDVTRHAMLNMGFFRESSELLERGRP